MAETKSTRTPKNFIDLTGQKFGRLTVVERVPNAWGPAARWRCSCDCGGETTTQGQVLRKGQSQSCGCLRRLATAHATAARFTTHGLCGHPLYSTWKGIVQRCTNPNHHLWPKWGALGITICPEWRHDVGAFVAYVGDRPEGCVLSRIDFGEGYRPGNVEWVLRSEFYARVFDLNQSKRTTR